MRRIAITVSLSVVLGCAASRPPPEPPAPAICVQDRRVEDSSDDVRFWTGLLLRGIDPTTRRATNPALDCTGTQVRWDGPVLACEDGSLVRTALPERPTTREDLIVTPVSPDLSLVWIVTSRFASGDALGPVALVETTARQYRVLSLGPLRAYPRRARLRLEAMGDRKVIVAEGETCGSADPTSCARAARVVPLSGDRFVPKTIQGDDGRCQSPAWFDLVRHEPRLARTGWERLDLTATLAFEGLELTVDEQVIVHELASASGASTRVLRRAQSQRNVHWTGDSLTGSGPALLGRLTSADAGSAR
jgi:hypothetical protein